MLTEKDITYLKDVLRFNQHLSPDEWSMLLAGVTRRTFKQATMLSGGASECNGLFVVESGQLRVFILSDKGKELTLYRLFERDVCLFSASCLFHNIQFDLHVEAEKNTSVYIIDPHVIEKLQSTNSFVAKFMNELMASRFSDVMSMFEQTVFLSFEERLAQYLMELSTIEGTNTLHVTHEKIASHLGSAREVVSRMLKQFEKLGIIKLERSTIIILEPKKLARFVSKVS